MLRMCRVDPSLEDAREVANATLRELLEFLRHAGHAGRHLARKRWGADHVPLLQGYRCSATTYLADTMFMDLSPDRFDEIRGFRRGRRCSTDGCATRLLAVYATDQPWDLRGVKIMASRQP